MERSNYKIWKDEEDVGLVVCTALGVSDPENFIDPKQNMQMFDSYK